MPMQVNYLLEMQQQACTGHPGPRCLACEERDPSLSYHVDIFPQRKGHCTQMLGFVYIR